MADQVAEVKNKVDIVNVVGQRVALKPAGKYQKGLCPFHAEKSPSFFVSPEMQMFKCFGCGKGGDVFTFLEEYEGMSFREVLEVLAEKVGVKLERYRPSQDEAEIGRMYEALDLAAEYFHFVLTKHPAGTLARQYLEKRGVDEGLVDKFRLGWAPDSWDGVAKYLMGKKKFGVEELEQVGLVGRSSGGRVYDRFRARVMFPLSDFRGRVVGFSGRLIKEGVREAKYINTPETKLYHKRELLYGLSQVRSVIRKKDKVFVVEGELDVISSYKAGVMNVVGIKGSALTQEQVKMLLRLTRNVVLCLDADAAGDTATHRAVEVADKLGVNVLVLSVKGGKDPDEVVRKDPKLWRDQVKETMSVYEYFIESAVERHGVDSGLGKKKVMEELGSVLGGINNRVEQAHYVGVVAKKLGVGTEVVEAEMERSEKKERLGETGVEKEEKEEVEDRRGKLERYVWGLVLSLEKKGFLQGWKKVEKVRWRGLGLGRLKQVVDKQVKDKEGFSLKRLVRGLEPELAGLVSKLYLTEKLVGMGGEEEVLGELERAVVELEKLARKERLGELTKEIATLEQKSELSKEEEKELLEKQREFSRVVARVEYW